MTSPTDYEHGIDGDTAGVGDVKVAAAFDAAGSDLLQRAVQAAFPLLVGGWLVRLVVTGEYRSYVRDSMWPWLTMSGIALVAGAAWLVSSRRARADTNRSRIGWLLIAPVFAMLLVSPGALGAGALDNAARSKPSSAASAEWDQLPATGPPVALTMYEFAERSYADAGRTLRGATVTLTGLVAPAKDGQGFRVVRFRIACCAADALAAAAEIVGWQGPTPPTNSWVTVVGRFHPSDIERLDPLIDATSITPIDQPAEPYEANIGNG